MMRQLILKELRLQRAALVMLGLIVAFWGVLMALTPLSDDYITAASKVRWGTLLAALYIYGVVLGSLLGLPLVLGAGLVAEERRLGMWDWQMSLPCGRGRQWLIKLALPALLIGVICLAMLPAMHALLFGLLKNVDDIKAMSEGIGHLTTKSVLLPGALLLLASAGLVSTFARQPYQAFVGGALLTGWITYTMLPAPLTTWWMIVGDLSKYFPWMRLLPVLFFFALFLAVAWVGWRNFRFAPWGTAKRIGVIVLLGLGAHVAAWLASMSIAPTKWLYTNSRENLEALRGAMMRERTGELATPLPAEVAPLLVKRAEVMQRVYDFRHESFMCVAPLPQTDWLVVGSPPARVNVRTGEQLPARGVMGTPERVSAQGGQFVVGETYTYDNAGGKLIGAAPWPIRVRGLLWRLGVRGEYGSMQSIMPEQDSFDGILDDKPLIDYNPGRSTVLAPGWMTVVLRGDQPTTILIRRDATTGGWRRVAQHESELPFLLSQNRAWYLDSTTGVLHSVEDEKSFQLEVSNEGGNLQVMYASFAFGLHQWRLGLENSASGRFIVYLREKNYPVLSDKEEAIRSRGFAGVYAFDTQISRSLPLLLAEPPVGEGPYPYTNLGWTTNPIRAWATCKERAAFIYKGMLTLWDYDEGRQAFREVKRIDLKGCQIQSMDFWDDQTLIAWGDLGVFRVDLGV